MTSFNPKHYTTMKNLFKRMMLVAVAAMGFTACSNDMTADLAPEMEQKMVTMTITADDDTRTYLTEGDGVVDFDWSSTGEALRVIEVADATPSTKASDVYALEGGKAKFTVSFTENTEAESFTYYAVYPEANYVTSENTNYEKFKVELPNAQAYVEGSYDPAADLMIAKPITTTLQPTELNMQFARLAALGKMTLKGMPEDKNITSLTFTAKGKALAGRAYVNLNTAEVSEYGYQGQSYETISMTIDEAAAINNDAVYFTCFPVELVEGDTFEVKAVTADMYTYTKSVTLGAGKTLAFTVGNLSTFTVNMATAEEVAPGKEFVLLDDASKLHVGDEIIIASAATDGARYAISTTQNSNNRKAAAVTIADGKITAVEGVAVLTVGKEGGNFTLYDPNGSTGAGYLFAASSTSNHLRTQATNNANGQWAISIDAEGKAATITAQGTNTRNQLRYNASNNPPIFSCYSSGQSAVYIYLNDINDTDPVVPVITAETTAVTLECTESEGTVTITTENVTGEVSYTLGEEYDWFDAELDEDGNLYYFAMANATEESRTATVTLSAEGAADVVVTFTQKAPAAVVEKISVADFIANADTETYYELTGVVSNVVNTTYGNFDLTDESGTIYVYGLYSTDGTANKYWDASGVKAGDVITVQGQYKYYDSTHDVVNARYISHYGITATAADTSIDAAGGDLTVTVGTVGTLPGAVVATVTDGSEYATVSLVGNTATVTFEENTSDAREATVTFTCGLASQSVTFKQSAAGAASETVVTMNIYADQGVMGTKTISWTSGDVTVTNNQASSSNAIRTDDSDHYRVYQNSKLVISIAEGTISKVVITCTASKYVSPMVTSFENADYTVTYSGNVVTVTGSASEFAMTASAQTRLSKVEVTYTK